MVTNSLVNSLNNFKDMAKPSQSTKSQWDDKFKELMSKDDKTERGDKSVSENKNRDDNQVSGKSDKTNADNSETKQAENPDVDEQTLSSEIAKMLVNVSPNVETVVMEETGACKIDSLNKGLVNANLEDAGVRALNGVDENNGVNSKLVGGLNEHLNNTNTNVNGEIASREQGKIQLNEGFKPVVGEGENSEIADLLKDEMTKAGVPDEKVGENLAMSVAVDNKVDVVRNTVVQNGEFIGESEAAFKPEETIDKMAKAFMKEVSQGKREMEIALEPANLGKLTIKVAYDGGKAIVSILCSERNLDVIAKNSAQIAGILQEYTGDDTKIVIEQPRPDYLNQQNDENNQQQREEEYKKENDKANDDKETGDFLEQLRLGLVKEV